MFKKNLKKKIISLGSLLVSASVLSSCSVSSGISGIIKNNLPTETPIVASTPDDMVKYDLYVVNCNQSISLRTAPSSSAAEIMQLALGVKVGYIDSAENGYYRVSVNGTVGYALASYLSGSPYVTSNDIAYYMYIVNCDDYVTLRTSESSSSSALTQIPYGATVGFISSAQNGFSKVSYNGLIGYVISSYISTYLPPHKPNDNYPDQPPANKPQSNTQTVSEADVLNFADGSIKAFVNGINTGDTTYISRYFSGSEATQEKKTHDSIREVVNSEEIISCNWLGTDFLTSNKATIIRDSVIRVYYKDGSVKDISEKYLYTIEIDGTSMKIVELEEMK